MENIKKFESVVFWKHGTMNRGRILDVKLEEDGMKLFIENLRTHEMLMLDAEMVYREKDCK